MVIALLFEILKRFYANDLPGYENPEEVQCLLRG
jgi:hypothetical protein